MDPKRPRPTPPPVAHPSHRPSWPSKPSSSLEYSRRLRGSSACPPSACCVPAEYPLSAHHGAHRRTRGMAHVVGPRSQRGELVHSGVSSAPGWDVFWRHGRHSAAGAMAGAPPQTGDRSDARSLRRSARTSNSMRTRSPRMSILITTCAGAVKRRGRARRLRRPRATGPEQIRNSKYAGSARGGDD